MINNRSRGDEESFALNPVLKWSAIGITVAATAFWLQKKCRSCSSKPCATTNMKGRNDTELSSSCAIHKKLPRHLINQSVNNVPTPALLIDMDILEDNMTKMNDSMKPFASSQVKIRPHYKANKCPDLVKVQSRIHGSLMSGVCCQKLSEAESIFMGQQTGELGTRDILITNEVVEKMKLERIVNAAFRNSKLKISLVVDNESVVRQLAHICKEKTMQADGQVKISLIIEYNVGQNRCGVNSIEELVHLATVITKDDSCAPYLHFAGIQCYQGWNQHIRSFGDRKQAVEKVNNMASDAKNALQESGLVSSDFIVTGGGTGSYLFEAGSNVFTEVQPGSYVFMDADYNKNLMESDRTVEDEPDSTFRQSLFVLTTVMSKAASNERAVVDAGMKAVSLDSGVPLLNDREQRKLAEYRPGGDEHGIIVPTNETDKSAIATLSVGDKLRLIPGHCDPTVNMHDWFICVRGDRVVDVWPIEGRSCGL